MQLNLKIYKMKKLFILRYSIIVFMILMIIGLLEICYNYLFNYEEHSILYQEGTFGIFTFYIGLSLSILFVLGLFYTQKMLGLFYKNLYFDLESISLMKKAGFCFVLFSVLSLIKNGYKSFESINVQLFDYLLTFTILLIGFGMFVFVDILKKGNKIQEENELTI